jgi:antitoxin component of RelBE/YafQ-DinJ toxin-antitoxin module
MQSKNITLRVKEDLYNKYREYCKKKGLLISRQVEIMMEKQLKNDN